MVFYVNEVVNMKWLCLLLFNKKQMVEVKEGLVIQIRSELLKFLF